MLTEEQLKVEEKLKILFKTTIELGIDFVIQSEVALALSGNIELLGFYSFLKILKNSNVLENITQKEIAQVMNISFPTFISYRNKLEQLKFIEIEEKPKSWGSEVIVFTRVPRLSEKDIERWEKTHGIEHKIKVLLELRQKIYPLTKQELEQQKILEQQKVEEIKQQELIEGLAKQKAHEIVKKKEDKKKQEEKKYPAADYQSVIHAYKKYKGVGVAPRSPDELRIRHAAKQMFKSGHKVGEIIQCLQFFKEHEGEEGFNWLNFWTIETVMKKMPEFKAGKLKVHSVFDDEEPL